MYGQRRLIQKVNAKNWTDHQAKGFFSGRKPISGGKRETPASILRSLSATFACPEKQKAGQVFPVRL
jgi:hypothetical protein